MFQTLHTMFEQQYTELWTALDEVAERIRSLGEPAPGSYKTFAKLTSIKEEEGVPEAKDMVRQLVAGHEAVAKTARSIFPAAEAGQDEVTADLPPHRMNVHEKADWMLSALLDGVALSAGRERPPVGRAG